MTTVFQHRYAYLIGVQDYRFVNKLETPLQDTKAVSSALSQYGFTSKHYDNPDRAEILSLLAELATLPDPETSQLVFYFAGHGKGVEVSDGEGQQQAVQGYVLPVDAQPGALETTAISMQAIAGAVSALRFPQVLLILDCCYAGMFRQATSRFRDMLDDAEAPLKKLRLEEFDYYTRYQARQVYTSTAYNQKALDSYQSGAATPVQNPISPFAEVLCQALNDPATVDNRDGVITIAELQTYIQRRLSGLAGGQQHEQNTCVFTLPEHEGGEFVFLTESFDYSSLESLGDAQNPYKGLQSYEPKDAALFCGREQAVKDLRERCAQFSEHPLQVVVGASGSGKSSLVKAGVVPHLSPKPLIIRPGLDPLASLAAVPMPEGAPPVLVVDQLEELVTQADNRRDATLIPAFFKTLFELYEQKKVSGILGTLRIEFVDPLKKAVESVRPGGWQQYPVPVLDVDDLQDIIITPALRMGWFYYPERSLVARIIREFRLYPNALPLLSLTLDDLFRRCAGRKDRTIKEEDFVEIGAVLKGKEADLKAVTTASGGAISDEFRQNLLRRFVTFQNGEYVRRRVTAGELLFDPAQNEARRALLDFLAKNRLINEVKQSGPQAEFRELAHEALILAWEPFRALRPEQLTQRVELAEATRRYFTGLQTQSLSDLEKTPEAERDEVWQGNPADRNPEVTRYSNAQLLSLLRATKSGAAQALTAAHSRWQWLRSALGFSGRTYFWVFLTFRRNFGSLAWVSDPERRFLRKSLGGVRRTRLLTLGFLLALVTSSSVVLEINLEAERQAELERQWAVQAQLKNTLRDLLKSGERLALGNSFSEAIRQYELVDSIVVKSRTINPDSLKPFFDSIHREATDQTALTRQREVVYRFVNSRLRKADSLAREPFQGAVPEVAALCQQYWVFIRADSLYRRATQKLAVSRGLFPKDFQNNWNALNDLASGGLNVTSIQLKNLKTSSQDISESYELNQQPALARKYADIGRAVDDYLNAPTGRAVRLVGHLSNRTNEMKNKK